MRPVEMSGDEVVETVVVNPRQPVGAFDVLPHPGLECRLDFRQLVLGGFGVGGVEHPFLDPERRASRPESAPGVERTGLNV